ncbi:Polycomb protein suz12-B [Gryllus bimaculatus]|nr:Polycomb protein suz12-B [Gryllus bimaculatus]
MAGYRLYGKHEVKGSNSQPVFLNRTLSYMKQRMSRTHKHRKGFSVDCLMERLVKKNRELQPETLGGYMTLTFLGFYDKRIETHQEPVKVETLLLKICHKKRKDVSSPFMQVSVGTSEVPINPSEDHPPPKAPTISIPTESFSLSNGHLVKSYVLLLRVTCTSSGSLSANADVDTEPAQKRRKSSGPQKGQVDEVKLYGSELVVYDKHNRCLLTDGDYDLVLQEVQTTIRGSPKKHSSWETIGDIKDVSYLECGPFEVFSKGPTLKFHLSWTTEPSNGLVDRPKPLQAADPLDSSSNKENHPDQKPIIKSEEPRLQIVYQFLYNNNSRQQTEACEDLTCPWCSLDCVSLYALLKHLKLCHSRFTFTYVPIPQGARIDVAINECYDGSYTGSPHDLISQPPGFAFSRNGPVRRTSVSNILVCRPKRPKPSLSEFLELDENEYDGQRPYITGHNRLYHHTTTCLPIYPKEMDIDSEGEHDPKWLQTKTMMMIDDFTDVNEGEKELMKMWNLHVMKHGYVGDCQIPLACTMFLESKGKELLMKNLYRNFVLHVCSLFDFGLVSPVTLYNTIQKLQDLITDNADVRDVLHESWKKQKDSWGFSNGLFQSPSSQDAKPTETSLRRKMAGQNLSNGFQPPDNKNHISLSGNVSPSDHGLRRKLICASNDVDSDHHVRSSLFGQQSPQTQSYSMVSQHNEEDQDRKHSLTCDVVKSQVSQNHCNGDKDSLTTQLSQSQTLEGGLKCTFKKEENQGEDEQRSTFQQQVKQEQQIQEQSQQLKHQTTNSNLQRQQQQTDTQDSNNQHTSQSGESTQGSHRRKSTGIQLQSLNAQSASHGIQNSSKNLILNGSTNLVPEIGLATVQRRKSANSVLATTSQNIAGNVVSSVNGVDTLMSQPRRKSLGPNQANGNLNHSDSLPPLRRKSFNQQSNEVSMGKSISENRQPLSSSVMSETTAVQHRRKSSSALSDANVLHVHSTKNGS